MEQFYPPQKYGATEHIDLPNYFNKFADLCENHKFADPTKDKDAIFKLMDMPLTDIVKNEILEYTNIDKYCPAENTIKQISIPREIISKEPGTSKNTKKRKRFSISIQDEEDDDNKDNSDDPDDPPDSPNTSTSDLRNDADTDTNIDLIRPGNEYCVSILVYKPMKGRLPEEICTRQVAMAPSHEVMVLGSQRLSELRDRIQCTMDMGFNVESRDCAEVPIEMDPRVKEMYPSAFLYIDGVFYNDMRHPKAIDYSEVIRTWAKKHPNIDPLKTEDMDKVRISDLTPRFNYPYVYQHRGECQHCFMFKFAHLITHTDRLNRKQYPYIGSLHLKLAHNCNICSTSIATRFIVESERLPLGVTYFCQTCYLSYNYIDGERIGDFKAYPLFDRCLLY